MPASIPRKKLGDDHVSAIGWLVPELTSSHNPTHLKGEYLKLLDDVFQSGCTFWDAAHGNGDSEILVGEWFKRTGNRPEVFLATKLDYTAKQRTTGLVSDASGHVREAVKASMERLGVDCIDLCYLDGPDPEVPTEKVVEAMAELVREKKVKYLGLSGCSASILRLASTIHHICALQVEYSPFTLDIQNNGLLEVAREVGTSIIAYFPLDRALLAGQIKGPEDLDEGDFRRRLGRYSGENFINILRLVDVLKKIGETHNGATGGQVAISWLLAQGDDIIPIPSTSHHKHLDENLGAANIKLSSLDVQEVCKLAQVVDAAGNSRPSPALSHPAETLPP